MQDMLTDRVYRYNEEINRWFTRFSIKTGKFLGYYRLINIFQSALAYAYVGFRVLSDRLGPQISIGSFSMYVNAAIQFTTVTVSLGESIMNIIQNLGYLEPFMIFMELPDEVHTGKVPFTCEIETIEFDNVSFRYPKSNQMVLENVSFTIRKGEKISVVAPNGAGKTTLVKLLCRLYRPTTGVIRINGRDIFEYEHQSYMKQIAAVFQDYKLFAFSIEENVTCKPCVGDERALMIMKDVGLYETIQSLPQNMASFYGKAYDESGVELSGGEGQKLAIARALYKDASLIILDEPTSALDPLAEAEVYEHFNDLVGNQTAIYISHRMSSSMFCDKILVIDKGRVVDFDHHQQLMKKTDGLYYRLFKAQAQNYQL